MNFFEEKALKLEDVIGYHFKDPLLLVEALSHSSYVNEHRADGRSCYERLEFLGDAVLELTSSMFLFNRYPNMSEGELSKLRASLVCEEALAPCARKIQLGDYILLGHGEAMNGGKERDSLLCDVIEAVIGALYLDSQDREAEKFIFRYILTEENLERHDYVDYKTRFQELVQANGITNASYELVEATGPDHNKQFVVELKVGDKILGRGTGSSRKRAEQAAAKEAIENFN